MDSNPEETLENPGPTPITPLSLPQAALLLQKHGAGSSCTNISFIASFNTRNTTYILRNEVNEEFIIRFSQKWLTKTENEVATLIYLRRNCRNVKIPNVLGFCMNESESITGYEYILMEKLNGLPLGKVFRDMSLSKKQKVMDNTVYVLSEFQRLKFDKIGSFVFKNSPSNYKIEDIEIEVGPLLEAGSKSGPFGTYLEYLIEMMTSEKEYASKFPILMEGEGPQLMERVQKLIDQISNKNNTPFLTPEVLNVEFSFCHVDLHAFNILVDEDTCEVTGVVDFEFSGSFPIDLEWMKCCSFACAKDTAMNFFKDGLRTMSVSDFENECHNAEEDEELRSYFMEECKKQGVKTLHEIPGYETRAMLHYLVKYICPWWIRDCVIDNDTTMQTLLRDRTTIRHRIKWILNQFNV